MYAIYLALVAPRLFHGSVFLCKILKLVGHFLRVAVLEVHYFKEVPTKQFFCTA